MPSQPQDSEKLTARIDRIIDRECPFADQALSNDERREMARVIAADLTIDYVDRYDRTPSVPGEDMREKARKFVGLHHFGGGVFSDNITLEALREFADEIAALLSSTAALAREEAAKIADTKARESHACMEMRKRAGATDDALAYSMDESVAKEIAAAIRAIGKEG